MPPASQPDPIAAEQIGALPGGSILESIGRGGQRFWVRLALTLALVAAATALRAALGLISPATTPFAGLYLAVLVASLAYGWRFGALALALGAVTAWWFFLEPIHHNALLRIGAPFSVLVYLVSGVLVVGVAQMMRDLVSRLEQSRAALAERNRDYDKLFETMSDGMAVCEAVWDEAGVLRDYVVVETNPALRRMLGERAGRAGSRLSDLDLDRERVLGLCARVLRTGAPEGFEHLDPTTGHSFEVRFSRASEQRLSQFFVDITQRKAEQHRQASMFEELNHRVKNNLTLVASMLQMQARQTTPEARDELLKAVDRVHSIAQVHQALYMGSHENAVDFGNYLKDLCASLAASLADDGRIVLSVETVNLVLPMDVVIPLGMAVNELVTNAAKHAYPPPLSGPVRVRFAQDGDHLRLSVGDQGRGFSGETRRRSGGLGMNLIAVLVDQVHGRLDVRNDAGATFEITLPAEAASPAGR
jgi:two-component sensor histidine kinase